ncbi:MAG: phosphate acyltransferase PlsX [Actinomycetia bacterium]|nr:phosphate acyltransferase PlsX [Actinomycetes bacterium]
MVPRIVVDVMGGDDAPSVVIEGIIAATHADQDLHVIAVGLPDAISALEEVSRVTCVGASQVIAMDEHPAGAIRTKKDSSIMVGCKLVKAGDAQGFFSAGSTGAVMAAATLGIGRLKGVSRPVLATVLPAINKPVILGDIGANADCKPEYLVQFALMMQAYASSVLQVSLPQVRLLNIGSEDTKGSQFAQECFALLSEHVPQFAGNIEGKEILDSQTDVIVTDGFTGNVALKTIEGTSKVVLSQVKSALTANLMSKLFAAPLSGQVKKLKAQMDPDQFGGAPLLGVKGVVVIGHGSSGSVAIANGIRVTATAIRNELTNKIAASL